MIFVHMRDTNTFPYMLLKVVVEFVVSLVEGLKSLDSVVNYKRQGSNQFVVTNRLTSHRFNDPRPTSFSQSSLKASCIIIS